jgi:hypothetical protein
MIFPGWVANKTKYQNAVQKLKAQLSERDVELSEENIKAQYIAMGGLVLKEVNKRGRPKNDKTADSASEE